MKRLILISLASFTIVFSSYAESIKLPPIPRETNNTIYGVDSNKNKVRDDVEIMIWNEITKNPELYLAYLSYAQSTEAIIYAYPKVQELKPLRKQNLSDLECISLLEKDNVKSSQSVGLIIKKVFDTVEREKILNWKHKNNEVYSEDYSGPKTSKKNELCRTP